MDEKNFKSLIYIIVSLVVGIIIGCGSTYFIYRNVSHGGAGGISLLPPVDSGKEWVIKIDKYVITKSDFDEYYKLYITQIPPNQLSSVPENVLKSNFLENLIGTYIINMKAVNDGTVGQPMAEMALRQSIFTIYMNKYSPQDKSIFKPSVDQINEFYQQHKSQIDPRMSADQIQQYLSQYLGEQNYEKWASDFINASKSSYKIVTNQEEMTKEGITGGLGLPSNNQVIQPQQPSILTTNK